MGSAVFKTVAGRCASVLGGFDSHPLPLDARPAVEAYGPFGSTKGLEILLDDVHTVVGMDNLNDAYDVRPKEWRLARLQDKANTLRLSNWSDCL